MQQTRIRREKYYNHDRILNKINLIIDQIRHIILPY